MSWVGVELGFWQLLSGRYRTEALTKHWSANKSGYCQSSTCYSVVETVEHVLIHCRAYNDFKKQLYSLWLSSTHPAVHCLVVETLSSDTGYLLQFILDCSVLSPVITATQEHGFVILKELFYLTRTWCFSVQKKQMKMVGIWRY